MECNAFIAGVHSVNSSVVVYSREVGGVNPWGDPSAGKTIAKALIDTYHVDIIVQVADFSGLGVISACQDAGSPYPMVIGTVGDQWSLAPNNTLTSVLMDTPRFMDTVVKSMIAGTFLGYKSIDIDLSALAPFHNLDPSVPSDVKTLLATTEAGIKAGTIVVPQDPTQPPDHSP
jgi:basic membrane lipoprotein Med (substrate-binding protein (PBP1-ABC) superfamily)